MDSIATEFPTEPPHFWGNCGAKRSCKFLYVPDGACVISEVCTYCRMSRGHCHLVLRQKRLVNCDASWPIVTFMLHVFDGNTQNSEIKFLIFPVFATTETPVPLAGFSALR